MDTTSPPQSLVLNNYGTVTLNIASITATTNFAETDNCVPSLAQGATCTIKLTFTPSTSGDVSGTLSMSDDAAGSPQMVSLSGKGSTDTPLLTGWCFAACQGQAKDPEACSAGQPAETPVQASIWPCGPAGGSVPVDASRTCRVKSTSRGGGNCVTQ